MEQSRARLEALLAEQYDYLVASAARFDEGYQHEWKRLAVALRVLLHDTASSTSLLGQLGVKDNLAFLDTDARRQPEPGRQIGYPVGWPVGLVGIRGGSGGGWDYFPMLDSDPESRGRHRPFAEWWETRLLDSPTGSDHWRRCDFVLGASNKEGGAHVQGDPPSWWTQLRDGTWFGAATTTGPDEASIPMTNLAPAVTRQIAYEVLTTLGDARLVTQYQPRALQPGAVVSFATLDLPAPGES